MAFAGALADVGLPPGQAPAALLLFNLGVETGQLSFIIVVLAASAVLSYTPVWSHFRQRPAARLVPAYTIGSLAAFWMIERAIAAVAV